MHGFEELRTDTAAVADDSRPWWKTLTRYHWFVLVVAALGWLFDCLDQQLFVLARPAAMRELLPVLDDPKAYEESIKVAGTYVTSIFLMGWAIGGIVFGVLGDRWGRAKTMMLTILMYSIFTGLSAFSQGFWDFALYRFLTGLGVGGEFAVGVALVAEVMPARARPYCLGMLQALSAVGNVTAAMINLGLSIAEEDGLPTSPWRIMFLVGALPALLALVIRRNLKEPEQWQEMRRHQTPGKQLGSYADLFANPLWRKHAVLGLVLSCAGVIGLWGVGFFTPDLMRSIQRPVQTDNAFRELIEAAKGANETERAAQLQALQQVQGEVPSELAGLQKEVNARIGARLGMWGSYTSLMINFGAFLGMFGFSTMAEKFGRKPVFAVAFIAAFLATAGVFLFLKGDWTMFILVPLMGFCQLALFAGYAMYFPELFPTHLRSTGTSFCYNVGRFVAAGGPFVLGQLISLFGDQAEPYRYAGATMSCIFLVGLLVLPFLPETKGKPLPE